MFLLARHNEHKQTRIDIMDISKIKIYQPNAEFLDICEEYGPLDAHNIERFVRSFLRSIIGNKSTPDPGGALSRATLRGGGGGVGCIFGSNGFTSFVSVLSFQSVGIV